MLRQNKITITSDQNAYQAFQQGITQAVAASNKAENFLQTNANKQLIVAEFIKAITHTTKSFNVYASSIFHKKLFFPFLEEFIFSFIAKNLYELKQVIGRDYADLLGADSIRNDIRKIEIYLNEQIMQLQDYQRSLQLSDKARQLVMEWQKNPLKRIDWEGLQQYKTELTTIQKQFKTYKTQQDPTEWLKPLVELSETLESTKLDTSLLFQPSQSVVQTNELEPGKDIYALERILNYLDLATTVDLDEEPLGTTLIERTLQVTGEYFKSTVDSPHLSPAMEQKLNSLKIPTSSIESLRNSLSHSGSFLFTLREEIKNKPNKLYIFKNIQADLSEIKKVLTKIVYRIHLKEIKSHVKAISNLQLTPEIQQIFSNIDISENLGAIEAYLQQIIEKVNSLTTIGDDEKTAISSQIDSIRINTKLKKTAEYIRNLEELNLNQADLQTILADLDAHVKLEDYNELMTYKRSHSITSKSVITEAAEMPGLKALPINTHSIDFEVSPTELFDLLVKEIFKGYEDLYQHLITSEITFGIEKNLDETLLSGEINRFYSETGLSFKLDEKKMLVKKFTLFNQLSLNKTSFLETLAEISHTPPTTSVLEEMAKQANLNPEQKRLLKSALFELHQELFFNRLFEIYFDSLLTKIKEKISEQDFNIFSDKFNEQKKIHRAFKKLLAFSNKQIPLSEANFQGLVNEITSLNPARKTKLLSSYKNPAEVKKILEAASAASLNHYASLLNGIKNKESITELKKKFMRFSASLDLDVAVKNKLDAIFEKNEIERFENLFLEKLNALSQLSHLKETSSLKVKAIYEMLLSDLTNIWKNLLKVADPLLRDKLSLESLLLDSLTIDKGFSLRNYLAHGDPLFDAIHPNFIEQVIENIPQLVKEAETWLVLKRLMDDTPIRNYLVENVIKQGHIDQLSAEALPNELQEHTDLLRKYKQSSRWKEYLTIISPDHRPASPIAPINWGKTLVKRLFERELREAAWLNDLAKLRYCFQQGINIEASDTRKWSAIYYAIDGESYDTFKFLLDENVRLDRLDSSGISVLHYMANNLNPSFASSLATKKKWCKKINKGKWSLLQIAAIRNNPTVIDSLVTNKISKINAANKQGFTALLAAVYFGHAELAESLVKTYKANMHATTKQKFSVVDLATFNNDFSLLRKLKEMDETLALGGNEGEWSAIHIAVLKNFSILLEYFIDNKVDPNLSGKEGATPLHIAAQEGHLGTIAYLMQLPNINLQKKNQHGQSILLTAVGNKQFAAAKKILEKCPELVNVADHKQWSPLHIAVLTNNPEITRYLLTKGADVDFSNYNGATAAHIAAGKGYLEILQWLKVRNASFDKINNDGFTLLHLASFHNHPEIVEYLVGLPNPLDINTLTKDGFTALHLAAFNGNTAVVEKLVKAPDIKIDEKTLAPNPDTENSQQAIKVKDATASHLAAKKGHLEILKLLEENGANLRLTGFGEWTHLHLAADLGHHAIVHYLLEKNPQIISIEAKIEDGETALHRAAYRGYSNIVDDLLDHDAKVDAKTSPQATPLHFAAIAGKLKIVDTLLRHGAKLDEKTSKGLTPLALATEHGHLNVVERLLSLGADPLAKNDHDTVLHRATMSANPKIIKSIIEKIKTQHAEKLEQALNAGDTEGDTPLIWAVQTKNPEVLEILLQEGANFQLTNQAADTAFDIAVKTPYPTVDHTNKESSGVRQKLEIAQQKKLIDLLYAKKYPSAEIQTMKDSLARLINEAFIKHLASLDFSTVSTLYNDFMQQGNDSFWSFIAESVKERLKKEHAKVAIDSTTQGESIALQDLLRTVTWVTLDNESLNALHTNSAVLAYKKLQKQTQLPPQAGCQSGTNRKRKRSAVLTCVDNKEIEKFDPLIELNEKEKEASTLLMASAQTAEQRTKLSETIIHIHQIKAEDPSNQSEMETGKLDLFHENIKKAIEKKEQYLQKINDITQAKVIRLSDYNGKSVYLSIHTESLSGNQPLSIYCPQINGYSPLQLNSDLPISKALELYATLLFPEQATQSLRYEYYTIPLNQLSTLYDPLQSLTTSDFRSDKTILESNNNLIEGLKTTEFRELFLINGEVPEIEQLHTDIFNDPDAIITFRSDKIVNKLWQMTPEQQTVLATVLNKYGILEDSPLITKDTLTVEVSLQEFNRKFIKQLKTVTPETPITHAELTERSKQYLREELSKEGFEPHEIEKIINNSVDLHGDLDQGLSRTAGMTRQGIFLAPAIIQAMNGDSRGLNNLLMMMGGDMAIDHAYQALISNARFIGRFPKTSGLLSKSARYLASPIGKVLLLDSFVELGKQMQESQTGSPEYQLAESLLIDNSLFFATMVAETLGLELGPAGIILDIGITIHQLLATAKYYRDTLPFKVTFGQSLLLTLGFKKVWLEEMLTENNLWDIGLQQLNHWSNVTGKQYASGLLRVPKLEERIEKVNCTSLPVAFQQQIARKLYDDIDTSEFKYTVPSTTVASGRSLARIPVVSKAYCEKKYFIINDDGPLTVSLQPAQHITLQQTDLFPRTRIQCNKQGKCEPRIRLDQGYWTVAASTIVPSGDAFPESPVSITGGQAVLMSNRHHPSLRSPGSEKRLLINFNPSFGAVKLAGGEFLRNQTLHIVIETISKTNLIDTKIFQDQPIKLETSYMDEFIKEIVYLVGDNHRASLIEDESHLNAVIILAPVSFAPEFDLQRSDLTKAACSLQNEGTFYLGVIGPRFIALNKKRKVSILLNKDYVLSGKVELKTLALQFEQVRGNVTNPATFLLTNEQSFGISLLTGKTSYQLDASTVLEVAFNDELAIQGPQIAKSSKKNIFKLLLKEPLSSLSVTKAALVTTLFLENKLAIKKFHSNATLSIPGNYLFKDNQTCRAELKIAHGITTLTLIDIADHKQLLRDPGFFNTTGRQDLDNLNFYDSTMRSSTSVSLHRDTQQIIYQAITYRFDSEHGLVAIQGRTQGNSTREDFSNILTSLIELQSNTTLPLRLNSTTIAFEERQLLNLKPSSYLLTAQGKVPIGILPLKLSTPQQGDSIRLDEVSGLLHPSAEIERVSLKPGVSGLSDSLIVHYRPKLRSKRTISTSIAEENNVEIYFKKSDDMLTKTVVIDGKIFPIDFSERPLLVDSETKQEKQLSIKLPVSSKHTWRYASAGISVAIFGTVALIARYLKPQNNNPLPTAAAALPLLPHATANVVKTLAETTATIGSFWSTGTQFNEKTQGKQSVKLHIEPFSSANKQNFSGSASFFSSNPASSLSDLGEQFCNKADKSGLLLLTHLYLQSRTHSKQTKTSKLQTFQKPKDRKQALEIANTLERKFTAKIQQQAKQLGVSYWDLAIKIDFTKLQKTLIDAIEVGNIEAVSFVLHDSIKGIKKLNFIATSDWKTLENYIDCLVDQLFFQMGSFKSIKQCKI